jgi:hypothetical protein
MKKNTAYKKYFKLFSPFLLLVISGCAINQNALPVCNDASFYAINSEQIEAFDKQGNAIAYPGVQLRQELAERNNILNSIRNIPKRAASFN